VQELLEDWATTLRAEAASYAQVALANIKREFPSGMWHIANSPGDSPYRPRARTPVFYGSFDWHSCVEMHWLLVRLLRAAPGAVPGDGIRKVLSGQFGRIGLAAEEEFIAGPDGLVERPYGWGWALALAQETAGWDDPDARRWAAALAPLATRISGLFRGWLPQMIYPVRHGVHSNTAFGLSLALPYATAQARAGAPGLLTAIRDRAGAWFGSDILYPAALEPSGQDFLSPALAEAVLMAQVLSPADFTEWIGAFLPGIGRREPATLFTPVTLPDGSDGYTAHLYGLNAHRAWSWRRLAAALPPGDPRVAVAADAARRHADAVLPHVVGSDYMVGHWLAAYAVAMLS